MVGAEPALVPVSRGNRTRRRWRFGLRFRRRRFVVGRSAVRGSEPDRAGSRSMGAATDWRHGLHDHDHLAAGQRSRQPCRCRQCRTRNELKSMHWLCPRLGYPRHREIRVHGTAQHSERAAHARPETWPAIQFAQRYGAMIRYPLCDQLANSPQGSRRWPARYSAVPAACPLGQPPAGRRAVNAARLR